MVQAMGVLQGGCMSPTLPRMRGCHIPQEAWPLHGPRHAPQPAAHPQCASQPCMGQPCAPCSTHCKQYGEQLDMLREREVEKYGESCPPLPIDLDDVSPWIGLLPGEWRIPLE